MKKLLILSGSSDYACNSHKERYDLIRSQAKIKGYNESKIISYPGQKSNDSMKSELTFNSSVDETFQRIIDFEKRQIQYDIICLSFGCNVLLQLMEDLDLKYSNRIALWGPTPQVTYYNLLIKAKENTYKEGINNLDVNYAQNIFTNIPSFDLQLSKYFRKHIIHIATGSLDKLSTPEYLKFLKSVFFDNGRFRFYDDVHGIGHSVNKSNHNYFKFLFG